MKYLMLIFIILAACGPKQQDVINTNIVSSDPLRDSMRWISTIPWWATDISPTNGNQTIHWVLAYDQECQSTAVLLNGTMTVSASSQLSTVQFSDLSCSYFDGTWTYAVSNNELTVCRTAPTVDPCVTFPN